MQCSHVGKSPGKLYAGARKQHELFHGTRCCTVKNRTLRLTSATLNAVGGCCRCWHDTEHDCINLITEFFTSGNLREYRQKHRHLELKAVRKWARQILSGLDYLHLKDPPVIHGDLRCDKVLTAPPPPPPPLSCFLHAT